MKKLPEERHATTPTVPMTVRVSARRTQHWATTNEQGLKPPLVRLTVLSKLFANHPPTTALTKRDSKGGQF